MKKLVSFFEAKNPNEKYEIRKVKNYVGKENIVLYIDGVCIHTFGERDEKRATKVFKPLKTDADYIEYYKKYVEISL